MKMKEKKIRKTWKGILCLVIIVMMLCGSTMVFAETGELTTQCIDANAFISDPWGTVGNQWHIPLVTVYIKRCRYSHDMLDEAKNFTLNIPLKGHLDPRTSIFGSKSGRDMDKIKESGISLLESKFVPSPALDIPSLILECKVIYRQEQNLALVEDPRAKRSYPLGTDQHCPHTMYQAEVLRAYIHE